MGYVIEQHGLRSETNHDNNVGFEGMMNVLNVICYVLNYVT